MLEERSATLMRRKLPDERQSITHQFSIGNLEGYITAGMYEDGSLGEIFIAMAKESSIISGLMDSFATAISIGLQYGVPLKFLVSKFTDVHFEPNGFTENPEIPHVKSVIDYIFRWLGAKFLEPPTEKATEESPLCASCGQAMVRTGTCWKCDNCGSTSGC